MPGQTLTGSDATTILQAADLIKQARIVDSSQQHPFLIQSMVLALDTAKNISDPYKIGFPFKTIFVQDATDTNVNVAVQLGARDSFQSTVTMKKNDALPLNNVVSEAYLSWPAQAGKTITIVFFTDADFRPGSTISVQAGGVSVSFGSTVALGAQVTLAAATAALIAPQLSTRKQATIQNNSGATIWIGDSTVTNSGSTQGIEVLNKGIITWQNTAGLYGYSVAGGNVNRIEEA